MNNALIIGLLRGDQSKGRFVDNLSEDYDIIARFQGGPNAGHTIYRNENKIVLHQIPSGILNKKICLIGHGCIIDVSKLILQISTVKSYIDIEWIRQNLYIAKGCHIITTKHIEEDTNRQNEGKGNGSTKCGISPCYRDKYYRQGIRIVDWIKELQNNKDIKDEFIKRVIEKSQKKLTEDSVIEIYNLIKQKLIDDTYYINYIWNDKKIMFEGAQGVFLDIDNPYYPNVSSSSVSVGGVITGTGISFNKMRDCKVIGVIKSYMSSVGVGYFPTEIKDSFTYKVLDKEYTITDKQIREAGQQYGATTGRPRKVGFLDLAMIKYACDTIGVNELCLSRIDTLMQAFPAKDYPYFPVCIGYGTMNNNLIFNVTNSWHDVVSQKLTPIYKMVKNWKTINDEEFFNFIKLIQNVSGVPIKVYSYGKEKEAIKKL